MAWIAALLAAYVVIQHFFVFGMAFVNDDYTILDKVGRASFASLWTAERPLWGWYRPWSRELHYWTLQRLFGARELPFHLASFALWLSLLVTYWALVRRIAGGAAAAVAVAGSAALAAWGVPLLWVAGVQELWMLLASLLALLAWLAGRRALSALALAVALLSKETAAVVAPLVVAVAFLVEGKSIKHHAEG